MRAPTPIRRRAVFWLLLPALLLLVIVAYFSPAPVDAPESWTWIVGHSVLLILVPAAVAATGAAWEAARLRERRVENTLNVRAPVPIVLDVLWPSVLCAVLTQAIAIALVALTVGGGRTGIPWGMIGAVGAVLFFHVCLGFAIGSVLRPVLGIPVALAASYVWLGFTGTLPSFELRHLSGLVIETCCLYDQQPIAESLVAASVFSLTAGFGLLIVGSAALRLVGGRMALSATVGVVLIAAGLAWGLVVADGLPPTSAEPRDESELVCGEGEVRVCLFPEQVDSDATVRVQTMLGRVRERGVDLPATVVASAGDDYDRERIRLRYQPGMSDEQVAGSLASDLPETVCAGEDDPTAIARDTVRSAAVVWLERAMLGSETSAEDLDDLDDSVRERLEALEAVTRERQVTWVNASISSLRDCGVAPPGMP